MRPPSPVSQRDPRGNFNAGNVRGHVDPRSGQVTHIERTNADGSRLVVHNSPGGVRHVESVSRDPYGHSMRTVGDGHRGFRERDLLRRPGYRQRTYFDHGHVYASIYHDHMYARYGGVYPVYVPAYYYSPAYYAWYGDPWGAPVAFGWGVTPGFAVYGGYFAPPAVYASPDAWMADYIINENLQASYQAQQDAVADAQARGAQAVAEPQVAQQQQPIAPEIRQQYVQEVKDSIAQTQAEAAGKAVDDPTPGALSPAHKVFQSYTDAEATDAAGQECELSGGDFVQREEDIPDSAKTVAVTVVAVAKPSAGHCAMSARVRLSVDTLQDWYNSFNEKEQAGFEALNANRGKNGIPAGPDPGRVANPMGQGTPDDANAMASAIQGQQSDASAMQAEATGGTGQ